MAKLRLVLIISIVIIGVVCAVVLAHIRAGTTANDYERFRCGNWLYFARIEEDSKDGIWRVNINGSGLSQVYPHRDFNAFRIYRGYLYIIRNNGIMRTDPDGRNPIELVPKDIAYVDGQQYSMTRGCKFFIKDGTIYFPVENSKLTQHGVALYDICQNTVSVVTINDQVTSNFYIEGNYLVTTDNKKINLLTGETEKAVPLMDKATVSGLARSCGYYFSQFYGFFRDEYLPSMRRMFFCFNLDGEIRTDSDGMWIIGYHDKYYIYAKSEDNKCAYYIARSPFETGKRFYDSSVYSHMCYTTDHHVILYIPEFSEHTNRKASYILVNIDNGKALTIDTIEPEENFSIIEEYWY